MNNYHLGEGGEILSLSPVLAAECSEHTHTVGPGGDGPLAGLGYTGVVLYLRPPPSSPAGAWERKGAYPEPLQLAEAGS